MAVVRIEVDFDVPLEGGVESAGSARVELDSPEPPTQLLKRAEAAIRKLIPEEPKPETAEVILTLNNLQFDPGSMKTMFGMGPGGYVAEVRDARLTSKGQCQERCPHDEAGHPPERCERPLAHLGSHQGDDGCEWGDANCNELLEFGSCPKLKGHEGPHIDNNRCSFTCPEKRHRPPLQCRLKRGHLGPHEGTGPGAEACAWTDRGVKPQRETCPDRVHWMGVGYGCERPEGHPDCHESALGLKWNDGGTIIQCRGEWGPAIPFGSGRACRLPEGHEGDCGPLPGEAVDHADCA